MIRSVYRAIGPAIFLSGCFIAPALSATVTVLPDGPTSGAAINLDVNNFERIGNCGGGGSVVNDGCSVVAKGDPNASHAFGRSAPPPTEYWIDSQDIDELKWTVNSPVSFSSMVFALTDAHDQLNSHFTLSFKDNGKWTPIWDIPTLQPNGKLFWLMVDFGREVASAEFLFSTKVGAGYDGYGISSVTVDGPAPVPVPPAAVMLLSGAALLSFVRQRRKFG